MLSRVFQVAVAVAIAMIMLTPVASQAENLAVKTPRGVTLAILADFPAGAGPWPAIVLAPGQAYPMTMPAIAATAGALVAHGIAVFRFNWAYYDAVPQGRPSGDLSVELEDLQSVLAAARSDPRVAGASLSVGGKSLGSVVAWRAFEADAILRSVLLLTPICSRTRPGEPEPQSVAQQNYPGFEAERRASLMISGDRDPLCAVPVLYRFAATRAGGARVAVVGGDHGFEDRSLPPAAADAARARNVNAVAAIAASFVAQMSSDAGRGRD